MMTEQTTPPKASPPPGGPRLAAVTMVKNECDIIELFVRINSRVFDFIHILDHGSNDGTADILARLTAEGYALSVSPVTELGFTQTETTTEAVRDIARRNAFDYIMTIDADEFLASATETSPRDVIRSLVARDRHGAVPWRTFCPVSDNYYSTAAPLYSNFRMREVEPLQFHKVVLGNDFAKDCTLTMGNHFARSEGFPAKPVALPLMLQHVPIRSSEQLVRKVVLGGYSMALNRNRLPLEGWHWELMAKRARASGYRLNAQDLLEMALSYSAHPAGKVPAHLAEEGPRVGTATDSIQFPDLAQIDLVQSFDAYIATLVAALKR